MSLAAPARADVRERTLTDRFLAAVPLLSIFLWLCVVYGWEAWRHGAPWLFGDELEFTQLSRAIAATGHAARRGQPHPFDSLYNYLVAPAWRIHDVRHAYAAVKDVNVVVMTATLFPAYGLARFVVGRRAALFAALASAAIPSLMYSSLIVEENLAYPYSTLCLFLIVGALVRRTRWWIGGAVVAALIAPLVRGELAAVPASFVLAALFVAWQSGVVRRWRDRWSVADWIGVAVLVVGAAVLLSAVAGHRSTEWLNATGFYKHRMLTYGFQAAGALTIGLGILPVVAGLASLWRGPGEAYRPELRAARSVLLAALICFGWYTAVKAAYLSTVFGTYVVERNLIYVSPLLFVGTALWLERRSVNLIAVAASALAALYLILTTPYEMQVRLYSQAPGFALLEWLNRTSLGLTPGGAKVLLVTILVVSVALLVVGQVVPPAAIPLALVAAAFVLVWNLGGELTAADASNALSRAARANIVGNPTWLDEHTHGAPTLYLGQQMTDQNGEWLLEFWNPSLKQVWSLDGTAQGPGPVLTPNLQATDGTLYPDPNYAYVVAERGIEIVGRQAAVHLHRAGGAIEAWRLYRVAPPLRLRASVTGISADGWSGLDDSSYTRYSSTGGRAGAMRILVSRREWGGADVPGHVTILMGTVVVGADKQPHIGKVTAVRHWVVHRNQARVFLIKAPGPRFRVEVHVNPKFVPAELDPNSSDRRELGAVVKYAFIDSQRKRR